MTHSLQKGKKKYRSELQTHINIVLNSSDQVRVPSDLPRLMVKIALVAQAQLRGQHRGARQVCGQVQDNALLPASGSVSF